MHSHPLFKSKTSEKTPSGKKFTIITEKTIQVGSDTYISLGDSLESGKIMTVGFALLSKNSRFVLIQQNDGKLVVYKKSIGSMFTPLWTSIFKGEKNDYNLELENDGSIVSFYD